MTNSLASIERFLTNLAAAYGWMPKRETVQFWSEKLMKFDLAEDQWSRALSRIVSNEETRPSLAQVCAYLRGQAFKQGAEIVPIFETFRDSTGRCHAGKTGKFTTSVPTYDQLRLPEEARKCFAEGYLDAGGNPQKLKEYVRAIVSKPEQERKPMWYDSEPEQDKCAR